MAGADSCDTLVNRHTRLLQLICGREVVDENSDTLMGFNELLDALFVLYHECAKDSFKRNKYAAGFVKKCESFNKFCTIKYRLAIRLLGSFFLLVITVR